MLVAIGALDPVDVVRTFCIRKGRVHLLYVGPTMGHLRMTGLTRGKRALIVAGMACEAAQAFVNAHRSAIVAGGHLRTPVIRGSSGAGLRLPRGVALVAQALTRVGTDLHGPGTVPELRKRE